MPKCINYIIAVIRSPRLLLTFFFHASSPGSIYNHFIANILDPQSPYPPTFTNAERNLLVSGFKWRRLRSTRRWISILFSCFCAFYCYQGTNILRLLILKTSTKSNLKIPCLTNHQTFLRIDNLYVNFDPC